MEKEFYIWIKPRAFGSNKCHLVTEFMDGEVEMVVYKNWSKNGNRWQYFAESKWLVEHKIKNNEGAGGK